MNPSALAVWPPSTIGKQHRNFKVMVSRVKKLLLSLGLTFLSIALVVLSIEFVLRFTAFRHLLEGEQFLENYYRADQEKGYDIRPNVKKMRTSVERHYIEYDVWSNELCCFDEPYYGEKEVILLVGDSFTHGFAPFEHKWGTQVQNLLEYRVLKCGVLGYGTSQELLKAKEIIAKINCKPQLIIVGYYWNDLEDDHSFPNATVVDGLLIPAAKYVNPKTGKLEMHQVEKQFSFLEKFTPRYPVSLREMVAYNLSQYSISFNLFKGALRKVSPPKDATADKFLSFRQPYMPKFWKKHEENLVAFKRLAAENQANLLIVIIPTDTQVYPFLSRRPGLDLERPNRILGQFLRAEGIDYLDLLPLFRKYVDNHPRPALSPEKDFYWRYNIHWSIKGEHLAGLIVAKYILEKDLVQVKEKDRKLTAIGKKLQRFQSP